MSELKKIRVAFAEDDGGFARKASHSFLSQLETRDIVRREGHGSAEELGVSTVSEAIGAVRQWQADVALVPYFNSISGLDDATAQELVKGGLQIVGELRTRTEHALVTSRSAFRTVLSTKGTADDVEKFDTNQLTEDDGKRLSTLFVNWLIDIFGHPKSFEQCNSFLSSQGLPSREHQRMQNDPVKMVLRISELVQNSRSSDGGGSFAGGFNPILLSPVTGANKSVTTEDLYTVATRGLLPIPSPFVAALAPKDFYQKVTEFKDKRSDHVHHDAPEYLKREIIELVHPRLTAFDPTNNVTRFLILARSGGDEDKLVYPIKRALLVCSGDECKLVERKIAFAAELKKRPSWSGLKDKLAASLARISGGAAKLMPPQFLEHPREQAVVFEAKFPLDQSLRDPDARAKSIQAQLKRLDSSGQETAKSLKDAAKGIKGAIYLGSYASLADIDVPLGDDEVSKTGCAVCDSVRAFVGRLAMAVIGLVLLGGLVFGLTQNVDCAKADQRSGFVCQYRELTSPIYSTVANQISSWWSAIPASTSSRAKTSETRTTNTNGTSSNRTTTAAAANSAQCTPAQSASSDSRVQFTETTLNCPADCNDKCVLEKRPGKAPSTRCFRAPVCPAAG